MVSWCVVFLLWLCAQTSRWTLDSFAELIVIEAQCAGIAKFGAFPLTQRDSLNDRCARTRSHIDRWRNNQISLSLGLGLRISCRTGCWDELDKILKVQWQLRVSDGVLTAVPRMWPSAAGNFFLPCQRIYTIYLCKCPLTSKWMTTKSFLYI